MFITNKKISLLLIVFLLLIVVPSSFAHENDTVATIDNESAVAVESIDNLEPLRGSNDYYFDASAENDNGNGSIDNPYKYLTASRIKANANIYLADGEYNLDQSKSIDQVNIIGSNTNSTIIKYNGVAFNVLNSLTLTNLTISDATILNYKNLNATNTVFCNGYGSNKDYYGNHYGGSIYCPYYSKDVTPIVNINNCTFLNNYAEYGGAIYMDGGSLDIIDTMFINNFAYNYGGAIAGEFGTKITISRSKFLNSYSVADAGGAIYTRVATLKITNTDIINSSATFGGAITTLNTDVSLGYLNAYNCTAKWDGGAAYHMYGNFTSNYCKFDNNSANNGGALYIDNSTNFYMRGNTFTNNKAISTAGAVYSICNTLKGAGSVRQYNNYAGNNAAFNNDAYEISSINLTIANGNYTMYKQNVSEITDIPSYYSLIDQGWVTIPKDQQSSGNCWAFTAISVLESAILKASGQYLDLSEENMKNVIELYSDYGWKMDTNEGGYDNMPIGYFVSWLGPVNETDDVFDDHGTLSPLFNSVMHVQNVIFLKRDDYLDNDAIKKAILQYGAVGTGMAYYGDYYYSTKDSYYCYDSSEKNNHAVTIVGWDDNYSKDNFKYYHKPEGDGAWIVRNSWGPSWGKNGYFYVSYYDTKFAQPGVDATAYAIILNDTIKYDRNYQYDIGGSTDYLFNGEDTLWYKNVFTADSDEFLAGVSTYFEKITNWTASVYVNGQFKAIKEGISNPGYYTFDLGQLIPLKLGDIFEVEFKVSSSGMASIPISEYYSLNKLTCQPEISYMSTDGINWEDLYYKVMSYGTHTYYGKQVACIKAFTILDEINTVTNLVIDYDGYNPVTITATVIDQYGNLLNNGNVTFNLGGSEFVVEVVNGMAQITHIFEGGLNAISATFDAVGYNASSDGSEIFINASVKTVLSAEDLVMYYKDGSSWNVRLTDVYGNPISGVKVNIGIPGRVYSIKTNASGIAKLAVNLVPGVYNFNASFSGENYGQSFVNATITVNKADVILSSDDLVMNYKDGSAYTVKLTDLNGNAIKNTAVSVSVGKSTYSRVTDNDGFARLPINLRAGNYTLSAVFSGNRYYNPSELIFSTVIVEKLVPVISAEDLVMTYKDGSAYEVTLKDNNGNPMANAVVKFAVGSATYNIKTKSDGVAKLPINLRVGQYTITASFSDVNYQTVQITNTITVNLKAFITASDINMTYKDGTSYDVQLVDSQGNPIAKSGEIVTFTLGTKSYNIKTNVNGTAKLPINLRAGNYTISAQYNDETVTNTIIVNKAD